MTPNVRYGMIAIIFLVIVWFFSLQSNLSSDNERLKEDLVALEHKAVGFSQLQKRWNKKGESKRLLNKLEGIKSFDKRFKKGPNEVIEYKELDAKTLDRLSYALFASDIVLVSVSIDKFGDKSSLKVEIKR
jgi:hypothetical protein